MVRALGRGLLALVAIVVLAIATALIVVHTDWGRDQLRAQLEARLAPMVNGSVRIGKLEGSVIGDVVLRDITVIDARGTARLRLDALRTNLGLTDLLAGRIHIEHLGLDNLAVTAVEPPAPAGDRPPAARALLQLADLIILDDEPLAWDVVIDRLTVTGTVAWTAPDDEGHLDDVVIDGRIAVGAGASLAIDATVALTARWRERFADLRVRGDVRLTSRSVVVSSATIALGGSSIEVTGVEATREQVTGTGTIGIAPEAWRTVVPGAPLVPDARLTLTARRGPGPRTVAVAIAGTVDGQPIDGAVHLDEPAQHLRGYLAARGLSLTGLTPAAPPGTLEAARVDVDVVIDPRAPTVDLAAVRAGAVVAATVAQPDAGRAEVTVVAGLARRELALSMIARGPGDAQAAVTARGRVLDGDDAVQVDRARLTAAVPAVEAIVAGGPVRRGAVAADLTVSGTVDAALRLRALAAAGTVTGTRLRVVAGGDVVPIDRVTVRATTRGDGTIAVTASSAPGRRTLVEAAATVDVAPERSAIALGRLRLRTPAIDVRGRGGRITIAPDRVTARGLALTVDGGTVEASGVYHRGGGGRAAGDVDVQARVAGVQLASVDRVLELGGVRGRLDADVDGRVRAGRFAGEVELALHEVQVRAGAPVIDLAASATLGPRRLTLDGAVRGPELGGAVFSIDVAPPRALTDPAAWRRLDAGAVRADVRVGPVDGSGEQAIDVATLARLAGADGAATGRLEGTVRFSDTGVAGRLAVRGVTTPASPDRLDAELVLSGGAAAPTAIDAAVTVAGVGTATARVTVATPARPFDVAAWTRLDHRALAGASLRAEQLELAPLAARLGLPAPWTGRVTVAVDAEPGLRAATARVIAAGVRGGPLRAPIDAELTATVDDRGIDGAAEVRLDGAPLARGDGHVAIDVRTLPGRGADLLLAAPLAAKLTATDVALASLLRAAGRERRRVRGEVDVTATVAGTLGRPTGTASVTLDQLGLGRRELGRLTATARWNGTTAELAVTGDQPGGGVLRLRAVAAPDRLAAATVSLDATAFDVGAVARLLPEPVTDLRGRLDAGLRIRGLDPAAATATGTVRLRDGQIPVAPTVGTLRAASLDVTVRDGKAQVTASGGLGAGRVGLTGQADLTGVVPDRAHLDVRVSDVQLVTELQPILSGRVRVDVTRTGERWRAAVVVRDGRVVVPEDSGQELATAELPADLIFTDADGRPGRRGGSVSIGARARPRAPFLVADVTLEPVEVQTEELRGEVVGALTAQLGTDALAVDGQLDAARAELTLFDRRYRVEEARVVFDGTVDPLLDIVLSHTFPSLTLFIAVGGRSSDPTISFRSDPSTYSQGELLAFVLGGSPDDQPGREVESAVTGAVTSTASSLATRLLAKQLPFRVDTLSVEAPTSTSSAAFKAGRWLSRNLYIAYRRRIEARADQNANEAELEYWLGRRMVLESITGDRGVHGLDLLWSRRW